MEPEWNDEEIKVFSTGKFKEIITLLNTKRKFLNAFEETVIEPGLAFTIEPRALPKERSNIPTIYFHTIAIFKQNGQKELLTNFDEIFRLVGMDYMIE